MDYTDNEIRNWAMEAAYRAGSFLKAFADSILRADSSNFGVLRPVAIHFMKKYPDYLK